MQPHPSPDHLPEQTAAVARAALPKGLPIFQGKTKYLVLAATKQWEKVEKKITDDKEDQLYIEGFSTAQPNFKSGIVVLAMNVNTLGLMRQRKK